MAFLAARTYKLWETLLDSGCRKWSRVHKRPCPYVPSTNWLLLDPLPALVVAATPPPPRAGLPLRCLNRSPSVMFNRQVARGECLPSVVGVCKPLTPHIRSGSVQPSAIGLLLRRPQVSPGWRRAFGTIGGAAHRRDIKNGRRH